jgi:hypothetical protein
MTKGDHDVDLQPEQLGYCQKDCADGRVSDSPFPAASKKNKSHVVRHQ